MGMRRGTRVALLAVALAGSIGFAAEELQPLPGMERRKDPKGLVSLELPRGTTEVGPDPKDPRQLQRWGLNWSEKGGEPFAYVYALHVRTYTNAALCGYVRGEKRYGTRIADTVKVGDGVFTELRRAEGQGYYFYRVLASEGDVYELCVQTNSRAYEDIGAQFRHLLTTFRVERKPPAPTPPAGMKESAVENCRVWSDTSGRDLQRVAKEFRAAWDLAVKVLPGEFADREPPLLIVCEDDAAYAGLWSQKSGAPEFTFQQGESRATVVRLSKRRDKDFAQALHRAAAAHAVRAYFGGPPAPWMEDGLRMYVAYGVIANGHFDQPFTKAIDTAREAAVRRNATLDQIFELGTADAVDRNNRDNELYAWHFFFRHGPGREKYGDLYDRHIDTLRSTGDVAAARKAWEQADLDVMRTEFVEWIKKWRK